MGTTHNGLTREQLEMLLAPVDRSYVDTLKFQKGQPEYIPEHIVSTMLLALFGPFGYDRLVMSCEQVGDEYIRKGKSKPGATEAPPDLLCVRYRAHVRVVVKATGVVLDGVGFHEAEVYVGTPANHDTAIKGAVTDATKNAVKWQSASFGAFLGDEKDPYGEHRANFFRTAPCMQGITRLKPAGVPTSSSNPPPPAKQSAPPAQEQAEPHPAPDNTPPNDTLPGAIATDGTAPGEADPFYDQPAQPPVDRVALTEALRDHLKTVWKARSSVAKDRGESPAFCADPTHMLPECCRAEQLTDHDGNAIAVRSSNDLAKLTEGALGWLEIQMRNEVAALGVAE